MRLIELEAVNRALTEIKRDYNPAQWRFPGEWASGVCDGVDYVKEELDKLPIIEERKRGYWICDDPFSALPKCSECGCRSCEAAADERATPYCPHCGAAMDEEASDGR